MTRTLTLAFLFAVAACGGKSAAPATTPMAHEHHHEMGGAEAEEHENMPAEMKAFHDVLAPRWHAEGGKRMADACAAVDQFVSAADALAKATPPVNANADTWTAGTRALVGAVAEMKASCTEATFTKVHEAFHALMGQTGMHHEEMKGEGGEHHH
jgi:hypothetical protein